MAPTGADRFLDRICRLYRALPAADARSAFGRRMDVTDPVVARAGDIDGALQQLGVTDAVRGPIRADGSYYMLFHVTDAALEHLCRATGPVLAGAETVGVWKPDPTGTGAGAVWVWAVRVPAYTGYTPEDASGPGLTVLRLMQMLQAKGVPLFLVLPTENVTTAHCSPLAELIEYSNAEWGWGKRKRQRRGAVTVIGGVDDPRLPKTGEPTTPAVPVLVWVSAQTDTPAPHPAESLEWTGRHAHTGSLGDLVTAAGIDGAWLADPSVWRSTAFLPSKGDAAPRVGMPRGGVRITVSGFAKQYAVVDKRKRLRGFVLQRGAFCRFGDPALMELDVNGLLRVLTVLANPDIAGVEEGPVDGGTPVMPELVEHPRPFPSVDADADPYFVFIAEPTEADPAAGRPGVVGDGKSVVLDGVAARAVAALCGLDLNVGHRGKAGAVITAGILALLATGAGIWAHQHHQARAAPGETVGPPATDTTAPVQPYRHQFPTCNTNTSATCFTPADEYPSITRWNQELEAQIADGARLFDSNQWPPYTADGKWFNDFLSKDKAWTNAKTDAARIDMAMKMNYDYSAMRRAAINDNREAWNKYIKRAGWNGGFTTLRMWLHWPLEVDGAWATTQHPATKELGDYFPRTVVASKEFAEARVPASMVRKIKTTATWWLMLKDSLDAKGEKASFVRSLADDDPDFLFKIGGVVKLWHKEIDKDSTLSAEVKARGHTMLASMMANCLELGMAGKLRAARPERVRPDVWQAFSDNLEKSIYVENEIERWLLAKWQAYEDSTMQG